MAFLTQVLLLMRKHLLVICRSKLWFILEMGMALLILPLIVFIVTHDATENDIAESISFDPFRITGNDEDVKRQVKNVRTIHNKLCVVPSVRPIFGYVANDSYGGEIMSMFAKRYSDSFRVKRFASVPLMLDSLQQDLDNSTLCPHYIGGVYFQSISKEQERLEYNFFVPHQKEHDSWHLDEFWPSDGPYAAIADLNSIPSMPEYWSSGFISIQFAIESSFLELLEKPYDVNVFMQRMPTPRHRNNGAVAFLKNTPTLWSLLILFTMLHTAKEVVTEKEAGIKTYMMVMGLDPMAFYASHFLIGLLKVWLVIGLCAGIFAYGFYNISPTMFFVFSLCFAMDAILFAILIAVIFRKSSTVITCVIAAWFGLMVLDSLASPSLTNVGHCMVAAFNPFTAFKLGIKVASTFESRLMDLGWLNMFAGSSLSFSFGLAYVMLLLNCGLLAFLIFYWDAVFPTDDSPRRSPFFIFGSLYQKFSKSKKNRPRFEDDTDCTQSSSTNENVQPEAGFGHDEADIDVRRISKVWETNGQVAVDSLSFRAFRGQITILLGHNGAGKSTTFSMLSGVTTCTAGDAYICGMSIAYDLRQCQKQIGYCPQYNPLFPKLTVFEHLQFYGRMKNASLCASSTERQHLNATIDALLCDIRLMPKRDTQAQHLSGGMKRKLCVAMALIGDSRVILLDEPTAGVDPEARQDFCTLLEKAKKNRTILLTTHYMDEADLLGDRIAIMVKGRVACSGSPEFLKNRFGTGYVLAVVLDKQKLASGPLLSKADDASFNAAVGDVLRMVRKHAPDARVENVHQPQFSIIIPTEYKRFFSDMFEELENRKVELRVASFGLSFNTLEQVFLKVGEMADPMDDSEQPDSGRVVQLASDLFRADRKSILRLELWVRQLMALLWRHYLSAIRNPIRTFLPIVLSLLMFTGFGVLLLIGTTEHDVREFNLRNLEALSYPLQMPDSVAQLPPTLNYTAVVSQIGAAAQPIYIPANQELQRALLSHAYDTPPLGIGASYRTQSTGNDSLFVLFNGAAIHAPPLSLLLLSNAVAGGGQRADSVKMTVHVYNQRDPDEDDLGKLIAVSSNFVVALLVILSFSSFTSMFVMPLIEDRQRRFKHQILLTKTKALLYWASVVIWCGGLFVIFCFFVAVVFTAFGWMTHCISSNVFLWGLYFWSAMPLICCATFLFDSPVRAFTSLLCWHVVMSVFAQILLTILTLYISTWAASFIERLAYISLPSYALSSGMLRVAMMCSIRMLNDTVLQTGSDGKDEQSEALDFGELMGDGGSTFADVVGWPLLACMLASGAFFWTVLFVVQSRTVALFWHQFSCQMHRNNVYRRVRDEPLDDEDVAQERNAMRNENDADLALAVRELYKFYGKKTCAVRNLTFGVKPKDCFGLLGVNGAGKTTTFDILTGYSYASSGSATIGGVNVVDAPSIGYCPQFDALPLELTGRETLVFLARLNGYTDAIDRAEKILWVIHMTDHADKQIQYYSGGQRRRLSIGVTLIGQSTLIMLDEPTAGIDPCTRRYIWQLLAAVRQQNIAILLTSHSMDECEALCNRIGFMNRGSLISIGTSQHLKSRYGSSFFITFTIGNPNPVTFRFLDTLVVKEFGAQPTTDTCSMSTLHWEVPRTAHTAWSQLFRKAQTIADSYTETAHLPPGSETPLIRDFSITQNSLEQVFLRLAQMSAADLGAANVLSTSSKPTSSG